MAAIARSSRSHLPSSFFEPYLINVRCSLSLIGTVRVLKHIVCCLQQQLQRNTYSTSARIIHKFLIARLSLIWHPTVIFEIYRFVIINKKKFISFNLWLYTLRVDYNVKETLQVKSTKLSD